MVLRVSKLFKTFSKWRRGRASASVHLEAGLIESSGLFDHEYYLAEYPDVAKANIDPIRHFVQFGWGEGRNPGPKFNTRYYLESNSDVAEAGINPLVHYISFGADEGRCPLPPARYIEVPRGPKISNALSEGQTALATAEAEITESGCFDESIYREHAGRLIADGDNAIRHFLDIGASAGLHPNQWFNVSYYLKENKDVENAGVNPFYHFLKYGAKELRSPSPEIDAVWLHLFNEELLSGRMSLPRFLMERWPTGGLKSRPAGKFSQNDKTSLVRAISSLIDAPDIARVCGKGLYRVGKVAEQIGARRLAKDVYKVGLEVNSEKPRYLRALAKVSQSLGEWDQYLTFADLLLSEGVRAPGLLHGKGVALYRTGQLQEAQIALKSSLETERSGDSAYFLGLVSEDMGLEADSAAAYATALRLAKVRLEDEVYGPGLLHEARGDHGRAIVAYERRMASIGPNAGLHYRLGRCYERLLKWQDAEAAYHSAIRLAEGYGPAKWHFRVGLVNERMGRLGVAAVAYRAAILLSSAPSEDWTYRLGYVLHALGRHDLACRAYLSGGASAGQSPTAGFSAAVSPDTLYALDEDVDRYITSCVQIGQHPAPIGVQLAGRAVGEFTEAATRLQKQGDWIGAAKAYETAADRQDEHDARLLRRAAFAYVQGGQAAEAARVLRFTRLIRHPYVEGINADRNNRPALLGSIYLEYINDLPVDEKIILYESFSGLSMACSPLAIFRRLIRMPGFSGFKHVWVINDRRRVPAEFTGRPDVIFVSRDSVSYVKYLATAKYLINNSGFPAYFIRRREQRYLATWHGTPLKTLGKDQKYKFYDHKRTQRNFLHATHIISPNPHTTDVLLDSYEIRSLFLGRLAETGYPRVDLTLNADERTRANLLARLSLREGRKVVLYAPTWRGTPDEVWFDFSRVQADLEELSKLDCQVIFRGHSWLERAINSAKLDCNVVPVDIDTNELLSVVDVLVTDYSSVFFDFYATGRPVVYYIYDHDEYMKDRGLYFDINELPGLKCKTSAELRDTVEVAIHQSALPIADVGRFNLHDDGNATSRVIEFFFRDAKSQYDVALTPTGRTRILMFAGAFADDDRTRLAIEFARSLDMARFELVVAFTPTAVELTARGVELFRQLPDGVIGLPLYGHALMTPEERWLCRKYGAGRLRDVGGEVAAAMAHAFKREFYRFTGGARFDVVLVFDGDSPYWTRLMLDGCGNGITVCVSRTGASPSGCSPHHTVSYSELEEAGTDVLMKLVQPSL
jgi:CDP-glycerol glycerophosphotransferase